MSRIVTVFKYSIATAILLALLLALLVLWLRFEFSRVQQAAAPAADWAQLEARPVNAEPPAAHPGCAQRHPEKRAWFGALHVHTATSYDATAFGVTTTVDEAYRFGRGETLPLRLAGDAPDYAAPLLTISSPLDFMAVTDHAEGLGENAICYDPAAEGHGALACRLYRGDVRLPTAEHLQSLVRLASFAIFGQDRSTRVCGADGQRCRQRAASVWQDNQRSTERWLDRSADCSFTTFHAYEYSLAREAANLHRNVIFSSAVVPPEAMSAKDAATPEHLWQWLDATCISGHEDCDVLTIPHNSNWSSGRMWYPYSNRANLSEEERLRLARLRQRVEPLAEIMQVKGDSECRNGIASVHGAPDELCDFEKLRPASEQIEDCGEDFGSGGMMLKGCMSRYSFVRYALTAGLAEEEKLGINPFKLGIVAATDTHIGMPVAGRESNHPGSHGNDRNPVHRLLGKVEVPGDIATGSPVRYNPGGIAGVYAEENTRAALFAAMQRRETFGTSGPRITPRFFAGWQLPADICEQPDYLQRAYRDGVPMGADLPPGTGTEGPVFVASAHRDPREGGNLLQRIQVIKGWIDDEGRTHQAVYDVAGAGPDEASVDPDSCAVSGRGFSQLCATWRDPEFDPAVAAVYYLRALENPSCRWSRHDCLRLDEAERPATCSDPELPWQVQERAWTSPIWYRPGNV